ncbi:E3 ubiquitin-protein ligase RNF144A-like [Ctenopharyngodon idella]|uniref:E3 ubiquitin-protein ligase RNF144A-like n=1 Tax=Ctenopharyngodon idella TaxID=7959 RepID=UPI002230BAEF|nr:E3 ubiquitin-protein ligase RNF144A-like [Ctenopharyngodon idella]XP_051749150.1 E3 ubiquitin-protein ligase RNF144A-like [Ctenopharyngodon idella]XP_051749151.1 E3 ubiquitin-protein ligase RNF144A-like [Ctenopharyngodon idella]XP_051749152.1 E3 ubiquitin-protein ligase RNF144A-like [Ctenopharyngodon idella]
MNAPKCPFCQQSDIGILDSQRAVCRSCSKSNRCVFQFCMACQREWPRDASTTKSCVLPDCALRAALLSNTRISDPQSSVRGCPFFRACPGCKALLTHSGIGCPNIVCPHCKTQFCFRCLRRWCPGIRNVDHIEFLTRGLAFSIGNEMRPCIVVDNKQSLTEL